MTRLSAFFLKHLFCTLSTTYPLHFLLSSHHLKMMVRVNRQLFLPSNCPTFRPALNLEFFPLIVYQDIGW